MAWELLSIGVGDYEQKRTFRRLPNAAVDAANIASFFGRVLPEGRRFTTKTMINPTATEVTTVIEEKLALLDDESIFILYFAGHAIQEQGKDRQWLLCKDALACFARGEEGTGGISSTYFNNSIRRRGRGRIFAIIDACRTEPTYHRGGGALPGMDQFGRDERAVVNKLEPELEEAPEYQATVYTLRSCQPGYTADDNGAFANALMDTVLERVQRADEAVIDAEFIADMTRRLQERNPRQRPDAAPSVAPFILVPRPAGLPRIVDKPQTNVPTPEEPQTPTPSDSQPEPVKPPQRRQTAQERTSSAKAAKWSASSRRKAGTRQTLKIGDAEYGFCWIPAGKFKMGSRTTEKDRDDDETLHDVELTKGFWTLESPVPQSLYEEVIGSNPSYFKGGNLPVENVSWDEAMEFCAELTKRLPSGLRASLPTEAQWEYACRAGTKTAFSFGNELNGDQANCDGNYPYGTTRTGKYLEETSPVKSYAPNAWGLYDMHGNVYEWVLDYYGAYPTGTVVDPKGPDTASLRVDRGGSWLSFARGCRSAYRGWFTPDYRNYYLGFRFLLSCD